MEKARQTGTENVEEEEERKKNGSILIVIGMLVRSISRHKKTGNVGIHTNALISREEKETKKKKRTIKQSYVRLESHRHL